MAGQNALPPVVSAGTLRTSKAHAARQVDAHNASTAPFAARTQVIPVTAGFNYPGG